MVRTTITIAIAWKYCSVYPREVPATFCKVGRGQFKAVPFAAWDITAVKTVTSQTPSGLSPFDSAMPRMLCPCGKFWPGGKRPILSHMSLTFSYNATHTDVSHQPQRHTILAAINSLTRPQVTLLKYTNKFMAEISEWAWGLPVQSRASSVHHSLIPDLTENTYGCVRTVGVSCKNSLFCWDQWLLGGAFGKP